MTATEIIEQWGDDNLVRVPASLLQGVELPAASKDFLRQVGLPKHFRIVGGADFDFLPIGPTSPSVPCPAEHQMLQVWDDVPSPDDYRFFLLSSADISDYFLCIHEGDGAIALVGILTEEPEYTIIFVNSHVQAWMECQLLDIAFRASINEEPTRAAVRRFKRDLKQIDPSAFDENNDYWPEHYWPLVIEDIMNYSGL